MVVAASDAGGVPHLTYDLSAKAVQDFADGKSNFAPPGKALSMRLRMRFRYLHHAQRPLAGPCAADVQELSQINNSRQAQPPLLFVGA
jgi:hypothetical protein